MRHELEFKCRVAGFFKLVATDAAGRKRVLADWFPNLITNGGLDQIGSTSNWLSGCSVGSGNTAPSDTDTQLATLVASTSTILGSVRSVLATTPFYGSCVNSYFFASGIATGVLAEIGVGALSTALFSRALILDGMGNPTTVTVLPGEALTAFYEFRNYPPLSDVTGSVTISGVATAYTMRAANVGSSAWEPSPLGDQDGPSLVTAFTGAIGAIGAQPSGASAAETSGSDPAYTPSQLFNTRNSLFGTAAANFSIESFLIQCGQVNGAMGQFQLGVSPSLVKDDSHTFTITVKKSWTRGPV